MNNLRKELRESYHVIEAYPLVDGQIQVFIDGSKYRAKVRRGHELEAVDDIEKNAPSNGRGIQYVIKKYNLEKMDG